MVLRAARYLRQHQAYRSVTIDKYKSADVMKKLRETRAECQQLNINAGCSTTDRKFIVIDGEIMTKGPDGKLKPYKPSASSAAHLPPAQCANMVKGKVASSGDHDVLLPTSLS